jgi:hypothetical protein
MDWLKFFQALPKWIFTFLAITTTILIVYVLAFADCRLVLFGLGFGPDNSCQGTGQGDSFPPGTIVAFDPVVRDARGERTGQFREFPHGWVICNGNLGVPDLDSRFLQGVTRLSQAGDYGGANEIPNDGLHKHPSEKSAEAAFGNDNNDDQFRTGDGGEHDHGGENRPAFYSVIFICKQ